MLTTATREGNISMAYHDLMIKPGKAGKWQQQYTQDLAGEHGSWCYIIIQFLTCSSYGITKPRDIVDLDT
jgi:hypothetical protein